MPLQSGEKGLVSTAFRRLLSRPAGVFWVFLAIYLFTWPGHYTSGDGAVKVDWARGLLFRGSSQLDPALGVAEQYSFYPIGHTLLAMPALVTSHLTQKFLGIRCEAALYTLLFVLNGALLLYLMARYLWPIYGVRRSWVTVAILGLATIWWPYTKVDLTEPVLFTTFFGGFLLLRSGRPFLGMLVAGLGWTLRPEAVLFVGLLGLWYLGRTRRLGHIVPMGLALIPAVVINAAANWIRWGKLFGFEGGYGAEAPGFEYPFLAGFFGILFSPGKSLFLFTPPLLLGFLGWNRLRERTATSLDAWLFASVFAVSVCLYSKWWDWASDDAWGVRFLIPGVMLMTLPAAEILHRRFLTGVLFTAGVAVQLLAVLLPPLEYVVMVHDCPSSRPAVHSKAGPRQVDLEDMWYHPRYGQLPGHWTLLRVMLGMPPARQPERQTRFTGLSLYECFPAEQWQAHATPDFIWWRLVDKARGVNRVPASSP